MKLLSITLAALSFHAFASDLPKRPPSFKVPEGTAVFADFTKATYEIVYDYGKKEASVVSRITLDTAEAGHVVFDLVGEPKSVTIDGVTAQAPERSPDNRTKVRVVNHLTTPGTHKLVIESSLTQLATFGPLGVSNGFWMDDLRDRSYLEKFLPTNFMYDRIPMVFTVSVIGAPGRQVVYANGVTQDLGNNAFKVTFPEGFNSASPFFHLVPAEVVLEKRESYKSIDGREIPIVIYFKKDLTTQPELRFDRIKRKTLGILELLEKDYGAFPHPSFTIYLVADGGMEYAGATLTNEANLGHEIFHSYFARGLMPADGNASWIDEALATWRDDGYRTLPAMPTGVVIQAQGRYFRHTDLLSYGFGEKFFAYLNGKLSGGLKPFLRDLIARRTFDPISLEEFIGEMNKFYRQDLTGEFRAFGVIKK